MARAECGFEGRPDELVQYGPTIVVRIGFTPEVSHDGGDRPSLPSTQFFALVDTGASESCIDSAVAMELGLPVVDREMVAGVHGAAPANVHLAHIYVPDLGIWINGRFAGVHLQAGGQPHSALIGRDVLRHFTMVYDGRTGMVSIEGDSAAG